MVSGVSARPISWSQAATYQTFLRNMGISLLAHGAKPAVKRCSRCLHDSPLSHGERVGVRGVWIIGEGEVLPNQCRIPPHPVPLPTGEGTGGGHPGRQPCTQTAISPDVIRFTPALAIAFHAFSSDPCVSMPRQASSTT